MPHTTCILANEHALCLCLSQVLGTGKLDKAVTVTAGAFSEAAKAAIEAAGGKAVVVQKKAWNRCVGAAGLGGGSGSGGGEKGMAQVRGQRGAGVV